MMDQHQLDMFEAAVGKTEGQKAYEEDCRRYPRFVDGRPRRPWEKLSKASRAAWEACPLPRRATLSPRRPLSASLQ